MSPLWRIRLGRRAERDLAEILIWTSKSFGPAQARTYAQTISQAIQALQQGPDILGVRLRDDVEPGIRTLHVARAGQKGHHFVVFRVSVNECIDVLRLLHDSMDLKRH